MKLTPLDIHHKEFRHSLRGYSEDEVDQFLDEVADEFERLFKENIDLSEKIEALQAKVNEFEMQRQTINNTLVTAQRSADDIISRADEEAGAILAHANGRAKEIVNDALAKKQNVRGELLRIKQAEEDFRAEYKGLLERALRSVTEIRVDDEVSALLGATEQQDADALLADAPAPSRRQAPTPQAPAPKDTPKAEEPSPSSGPSGVGPSSDESQPSSAGVLQPTEAMPPIEPPKPGFVHSVALGEIDSPQMPPDVELVEPSEFALPGFDALGEREDDIDIEEID